MAQLDQPMKRNEVEKDIREAYSFVPEFYRSFRAHLHSGLGIRDFVAFADEDEPIRRGKRQPAQYHVIDDREDGGRSTDAQREHGQRDDREAW